MNFDAWKSAMCVAPRGIMRLVVYADGQSTARLRTAQHRDDPLACRDKPFTGRIAALRGTKRRAEDKTR
jgi:hypothetical protein